MSVIRVKHNKENPFVQLNKEALWNEKISLKAIGLWARCMSRPDDWRFNIEELVSKSKEGRRAIDSAIKELIENDYAVRLEHWDKGENGQFTAGGVEYVFFEFPATKDEKEEVLQEFKKFYRLCGFGNRRDGNSRNDQLLIKKEKEIEIPPLPSIKSKKNPTYTEEEEDYFSEFMKTWNHAKNRVIHLPGLKKSKIEEFRLEKEWKALSVEKSKAKEADAVINSEKAQKIFIDWRDHPENWKCKISIDYQGILYGSFENSNRIISTYQSTLAWDEEVNTWRAK